LRAAALLANSGPPPITSLRTTDRLIATRGLRRARAEFICDEKSRADFFEETSAPADAMETAHWLMSE
jgi:Asp-tRNA(Asn)/Glu-tRNA(Gln) amidotransferase B subunit